MKFQHVHHSDPRFPDLVWDEWLSNCGKYKITSTSFGDDGFAAYFIGQGDGQYAGTPPDKVPCKGCGSAHCTGTHMKWSTLDRAKEACVEHALNLPW